MEPEVNKEPTENHKNQESLADLIRGIVQDARSLFTKEITAAKLEIAEEIKSAVSSSISLGVGVFLTAVGFVLLTIALALLLSQYTVLDLWVSFGVVGVAICLVGTILVLTGKGKLGKTKALPQDSLRSAKEDARYIRQKASGH